MQKKVNKKIYLVPIYFRDYIFRIKARLSIQKLLTFPIIGET